MPGCPNTLLLLLVAVLACPSNARPLLWQRSRSPSPTGSWPTTGTTTTSPVPALTQTVSPAPAPSTRTTYPWRLPSPSPAPVYRSPVPSPSPAPVYRSPALSPSLSPASSPAPVSSPAPSTSPAPVGSPPPSTSPAPASPSLSPAPAPTAGGCPDVQATLDAHNAARAARGASPLSWSASLASSAQAYANRCVFQHSGTSGVGENLYTSSSAGATCSNAVTAWVAEAPYYSGSYSSSTGHWTQVVWKSTTAVGCGLARCSFGTLVVCQYSPPGNYLSQFAANV